MPAKSGKQTQKKRKKTNQGAVKRNGVRKTGRKTAPKKTVAVPAALTFRQRTPADDEFILKLTESELGQVHAQSFGEAFPRSQFLGYLQSGAPTVVVEQGKTPIGYYSYLVAPDGKMHVTALVIDAKHQSDGIGTQVMTKLEDDARNQRVHTMEVFVQESNQRSMAFTKKLGFTEVYRLEPNSICFQKVIARTDGTSVAVGPLMQGQPGVLPPGDGVPLW